MVCEEAQKLNTEFIRNELPERRLEEYLRHVDSCAECYNELEIMYIIAKGLDDSQDTVLEHYNFPVLLADHLEAARTYVKNCHRRKRIMTITTFLVYVLLVVVIAYFVISLSL